jgi:hypothetical protein
MKCSYFTGTAEKLSPDRYEFNNLTSLISIRRKSLSSVPSKVLVDTPCNCALKCNTTIPKDNRERIFKHFYLLNWNLKSAFIDSC